MVQKSEDLGFFYLHLELNKILWFWKIENYKLEFMQVCNKESVPVAQ